ncbi:MAG: HAD-IA family hydrolase [bacterium]
MIRCIALDFGGVLVQINPMWADALEQAGFPRQELGHLVDFPGSDPLGNGSWSEEKYLEELAVYLGLPVEDAEKVHAAILKAEYPGMHALVLKLQSKGFKVAALSNTSAGHVATILKNCPACAALDQVVASYDVGFNKPERGIYEVFEQRLGFGPHEIVFFDDWDYNVAGAEACGWRAYRVDPTGDTAGQIAAFLRELKVLD